MIKRDIFMAHVIKVGVDTCWKWDGAKLKHGYGRYKISAAVKRTWENRYASA